MKRTLCSVYRAREESSWSEFIELAPRDLWPLTGDWEEHRHQVFLNSAKGREVLAVFEKNHGRKECATAWAIWLVSVDALGEAECDSFKLETA